jgi:hypothetical protein
MKKATSLLISLPVETQNTFISFFHISHKRVKKECIIFYIGITLFAAIFAVDELNSFSFQYIVKSTFWTLVTKNMSASQLFKIFLHVARASSKVIIA